ncbi:hypothetical protein AAFF_G00395670 [Aldrovandia affinis]|uniref:Uncharacterized protein n=1 Tax=Aldrovandia affinis TaxID=143900 RepID=A0AAD7SDS6_9TELE|nr:hypothetical protein AAFF_G00395670 [Aldrovandia affinis]
MVFLSVHSFCRVVGSSQTPFSPRAEGAFARHDAESGPGPQGEMQTFPRVTCRQSGAEHAGFWSQIPVAGFGFYFVLSSAVTAHLTAVIVSLLPPHSQEDQPAPAPCSAWVSTESTEREMGTVYARVGLSATLAADKEESKRLAFRKCAGPASLFLAFEVDRGGWCLEDESLRIKTQ